MGLLGILLVLHSAEGSAQSPSTSFQAEHFELLPVLEGNLLHIATSHVLPDKEYSTGILLHYSDDPIRLVREGATSTVVERVVSSKLTMEAAGGVGLYDLADIGIALPIVVYQNGGDLGLFGRPGDQVDGLALGDMRIVPRIRLPMPTKKYKGLGIAFAGPWYVPIGDRNTFNSDGDVRVEPRVIVDWRHRNGFLVAGNVGVQFRPRRTAFNFVSDDMVRWGIGTEIPINFREIRILGSAFGTVATVSGRNPGNLGEPRRDDRANPIELLLGARFPIGDLTGHVAASAGVTRGVGAPDWRVIAGVSWSTPGATRMLAAAPTKLDRYTDRDSDGIQDQKDDCPDEPETFNGVDDGDGCPDEGEAQVRVTDTNIEFDGKIFFIIDDARIQEQSQSILQEVARVLKANAAIVKVRVEGYTDNQGSESYNMRLSQERAEEVCLFLHEIGIAPDRLDAVGYGEANPVSENDTPEGRAKNRRVEFKILETTK